MLDEKDLIKIDGIELLFNPQAKETQKEFKKNVLKKYDWFLALLIIILVIIIIFYANQYGMITALKGALNV